MPDNNKHYELLLLNAEQPLQCTNPNQWNAANSDSVKSFIDTIETSVGTDKEATEKYRTMISGVPSPWARVTITRKAIAFMPKRSDNVLALCYRTFRSEWRGLMAAYVLRADSFEFSDPIPLTGPTVEQNMGEMSVLETYGEMLFDDQPLWTLPSLARRISEIAFCSSAAQSPEGSPLKRMHPSPNAEPRMPSFPKVRYFMAGPPSE